MCICVGESEMSDTRIYVGEATRNVTPVYVNYINDVVPNIMSRKSIRWKGLI